MRRRLWLVLVVGALLGLAVAVPVALGQSNADCLVCHAVGDNAQVFEVTTEYDKCDSCHWVEKHWFDESHVSQGFPNYMSATDCNLCHRGEFFFPPRPAVIGNPTYSTPYGWFQSADSLQSSAEDIHGIHANGSWLKDNMGCNGCHGNAACSACHGDVDGTHADHTLLATQNVPVEIGIGKAFGDTCADTYMYSYRPDTNYDSATAMYVGNTGSGEERAILRFPLDRIPADADITTATLTLKRSTGSAFTLRAYRLRRSDWSAPQTTWNRFKTGTAWGAPGAGSSATDYYASPFVESSSEDFDLTPLLQAALDAGDDYLDVVLVDPAPVARRYTGFYTSQTSVADWYPKLTVLGTRLDTPYAYPPVTYEACGGVEPGQIGSTPQEVTSTCANESCHPLASASTADFVPQCTASCHPFESLAESHEAAHTPAGLDPRCASCHQDSLTGEHMTNTETQSELLTCGACHGDTERDVTWAVASGDKSCSACHESAHGLTLIEAATDVPLHPLLQWSPVLEASLFAGEAWLPDEFASGAAVFSSRSETLTAGQVWEYYEAEMTNLGWMLVSPAPQPGAEEIDVAFQRGSHRVRLLYGTAGPSDSVGDAGARVVLLFE